MHVISPASVPFFDGVDDAGRRLVMDRAERRVVRKGAVVLRRGARGRELLVVASGGLTVDLGGGTPPIPVPPGEVVGEVSLASGLPVTATVVAARDSELWAIPADVFLTLFESQVALRQRVADLLVRRFHDREGTAGGIDPGRVMIVGLPRDARLGTAWLDVLTRAVRAQHDPTDVVTPGSHGDAVQEIRRWRDGGGAGESRLIAVPGDVVDRLASHVERGDVVVKHDEQGLPDATLALASWGLAEVATVRPSDGPRPGPLQRWAHPLDPEEVARCTDGSPPTRRRAPGVDRLARWLTGRQVGLALSAGAALGFAHLGVLSELERLGLPIDVIAGTSMGGVAGLMYGLAGEGEAAVEKCAWTLGRPGARRIRLLPRGAILSERALRRRGETVAEGRSLSELAVPVSVVSCDLVRGERVVIDRGPVADAFFATSAVPGVLPPVRDRDRLLVDGALISRVPVDLLPRTRCRVRIAVNVIPSPDASDDTARRADALQARMDRPFGFVHALARSWDLLGWWHGARDAADADVLLEPATAEHSGLQFASSWHALVEAGRDAVREHADELRTAAHGLVEPSDGERPAPTV